jgi:hypothetical protein
VSLPHGADRAGYGSVFLIGGGAAGLGFVIALGLRRTQRLPCPAS